MNGHLITVEVGVERRADERMDLDRLALDQNRLERLDAQTMERRSAVEKDRMLLDHFLERVPYLGFLQLDELLCGLDRADQTLLFEPLVDERLEQLESHLLGQTALIELELRSDDDDRTARVVDALSEKVLTEASLLTLEGVGERLERAVVRALEDPATASVVEQRVDRLLEHPLLVAHDDVGRAELEELLETVVAVDDPAVQIIEIRSREPAAIEGNQWTQLRRNDRDHVEDHPFGTVTRLAERIDDLESLGRLELLDLRGLGTHHETQLVGELFDVDTLEELLDRLGTHLRDEDFAVLSLELAELLLGEELLLVENLGNVTRIDHDVRLEVEDPLEVTQGDVEKVSDPRRQALEEPDVRDRRGQLDVPHALATNLRLGDFDATLVADHAAVLHPLVLPAEALPVGDRSEDLGAEESVTLRLERAVVDGFRLCYLAVRPRADLLRRRQRDLDRIEVVQRLGLRRLKQCVKAFQCCLRSFQNPWATGAAGRDDRPPGIGYSFSSSTSRQSDWSSRTSTLNDSGRPGSSGTSPLTIDS